MNKGVFPALLAGVQLTLLALGRSAIAHFGIASFYFAGLCDYLFHRHASHSRLL